jgi:hypothetical protein
MQRVLIVVLGLIFGVCLAYFITPKGEGRYYNCSIAEISPDYPIEVKEACRKLRTEKIK